MIISRRVGALVALGLALTGCGTTVQGSPAPATEPSAGASADGPPVDACALLKPEEVQALIGTNDGGKGSTTGRSVCTWTNPDELSVTVDIAQPGTAPNGLPPWDPAFGPERTLGDGFRSLGGGGQVEFVAGTRDCSVQVVTDPTSKADDDKAVQLAKLIQTRI